MNITFTSDITCNLACRIYLYKQKDFKLNSSYWNDYWYYIIKKGIVPAEKISSLAQQVPTGGGRD